MAVNVENIPVQTGRSLRWINQARPPAGPLHAGRSTVMPLMQVNRQTWIHAHDLFIDPPMPAAFAAPTVEIRHSMRGGSMGIDMQIVYLGFAGSAQIESEAAAQLVRLERFSRAISGCHLALEAIRGQAPQDAESAESAIHEPEQRLFDARLDLVLRSGELVPVEHRQSADADRAVHEAFDAAERMLERETARR